VQQAKYLVERNPQAALRFLRAVRKSYDRIRSAPDLGEVWGESDAQDHSCRCWCVRGFEKYVIYFRVLSTSIEILRVLHSAQDAEGKLRSLDSQAFLMKPTNSKRFA